MKRIPRRIFVAGLRGGLRPGLREEFKREAIELVAEQGLTIAEASKALVPREKITPSITFYES